MRSVESSCAIRPARATSLVPEAGPSHATAAPPKIKFISAPIEMGAQDATAWLNMPPGADEPWQVDPLDAFTERGRPAEENS